MKKNIRFIALIYLGVAVFTYCLTLRVDRLEAQEDIISKNESLVIRLK